jgi:polyribonucleotide nucleotidyltransferase
MVTQLGSGEYHHSSQVLGTPVSAGGVQERRSSPDEVTFQIPRHSVGGIIGKGGQALKDLQTEFGVRVYVEREEVAGMRLVVLKPLSNTEPAGEQERAALQRCQERIMALSVQEQASEMKEV